jgi:hypothetical protein
MNRPAASSQWWSAVLVASGILWLLASLFPAWSGLDRWEWTHDFLPIWIPETTLIIVAGVIGFWSPAMSTALAVPAIVFRAISIFQFVVPSSGFQSSPRFSFWLDLIGWIVALVSAAFLLNYAKPIWRVDHVALLVGLVVLLITFAWSIAATLPWISTTYVAPVGRWWTANHERFLNAKCCSSWDSSLRGGAQFIDWTQALIVPVIAFASTIRRGNPTRGLGLIATAVLMLTIPVSVYASIDQTNRYWHLARPTLKAFRVTSHSTVKVHVMSISAILIFVIGLGFSLWDLGTKRLESEPDVLLPFAIQ